MNPRLGWSLAIVALAVGAVSYGWRGLALVASIVAFWLLLQFNRSVKVMRVAADAPVGHVPSAVMLHAKLRIGLPMLQVVAQTGSLGRHLGGVPEQWSWADASGAEVRIAFGDGRTVGWSLVRPDVDRSDDERPEDKRSDADRPDAGRPDNVSSTALPTPPATP